MKRRNWGKHPYHPCDKASMWLRKKDEEIGNMMLHGSGDSNMAMATRGTIQHPGLRAIQVILGVETMGIKWCPREIHADGMSPLVSQTRVVDGKTTIFDGRDVDFYKCHNGRLHFGVLHWVCQPYKNQGKQRPGQWRKPNTKQRIKAANTLFFFTDILPSKKLTWLAGESPMSYDVNIPLMSERFHR